MSGKMVAWKMLAVPALGIAMTIGAARTQAADTPPPANTPNNNEPNAEIRPRTPQEFQARMIRGALTKAGLGDTTLQNAVVAFADAQETARRDLRDAMRKLRDAANDTTTTDAQLSTQLAALKSAAAAEKTRGAKAESALDAQIGFSGKPRLNAVLTTLGLVGDAAAYAGGPGGGRPPGERGGRGGRGENGGPNGGGPNGGGPNGGGPNGGSEDGQRGGPPPRDENGPPMDDSNGDNPPPRES